MSKKNKNKIQEYTLLQSNIKYVNIISRMRDKFEYIKSYIRYIEGEIDVLTWMDVIDEMIVGTYMTDKEVEYLNDVLNQKILKDEYSIGNILTEINIIQNESFTLDKKEEKLRNLLSKCTSSGYKYNYKDPKRTTPRDLREYTNRNWVKCVVTNPVGRKR